MMEQNSQGLMYDITKEIQKLNDFQVLTTSLLQEEIEHRVVQGITAILSSLWSKCIWLIALRSVGALERYIESLWTSL